MEWQPIETAPLGVEVLIYERDGCFVAWWDGITKKWLWTSHNLDGDEVVRPTHWMPLPEPPQ